MYSPDEPGIEAGAQCGAAGRSHGGGDELAEQRERASAKAHTVACFDADAGAERTGADREQRAGE